jgi:SAM-dependent methyltransferase
MLAGLDGDAAAHKELLRRLSGYLRAYFKTRLAQFDKSPADTEDLVQETLIALHTRRHTYERSQPLTEADVAIDDAEEILAEDEPSSVESGLDLQKLMAQLTPKTRQASFDRALAINSMQYWPQAVVGLREVRRVMKAGGVIALGFTPYSGQPNKGLVEALTAAGFAQAHVVESDKGFCALATKA